MVASEFSLKFALGTVKKKTIENNIVREKVCYFLTKYGLLLLLHTQAYSLISLGCYF
jgi:hypothetical protein